MSVLDFPFFFFFLEVSMKPLVSILTPTYNRRVFIPQYLKYVKNQDYPQDCIEILIADDSDEPMYDLLEDIPNVKYMYSDKKQVFGYKRKLLCDEAKGDIIVQMDDDDYYYPTHISNAVDALLNSDKLIAGSSKMYVYHAYTQEIFITGPFHQNHATDGTFVFKKEYLENHSYNPHEVRDLKAEFTNNLTEPMIQLENPGILIWHGGIQTSPKHVAKMKTTKLRLKDLIKDKDDIEFYNNLS